MLNFKRLSKDCQKIIRPIVLVFISTNAVGLIFLYLFFNNRLLLT
nr:MAG TPA: hypothetical protein [Caudoviricetes sp.]